MAVTPDINRYGEGSLGINASTGTRTVTGTHSAGTAWPNAHVETTSINIDLITQTTGVGPPSGEWGIAVVEDIADPNGDYTTGVGTDAPNTAGGVLFYKTIGSGAVFPTTVTATGLNKGGTYRIVITVGDSADSARRRSSVSTTGGSTQYHGDSDGNFGRGGLAVVTSLFGRIVGVAGQRVVMTTRTPTAGNWRYPQQNQVAVSLRPAGNTGASLINPKEIKLAISQSSGSGVIPTGQGKLLRATPNSTGDVTYSSIPVDTDFTEATGGTDHFVQMGVNNVFGDATTPSNERAGIYAIGTREGTTDSQLSAFLFASSGHVANTTVESQNRLRSTTAPVKASARIQVFKDVGKVTPGVGTFQTSAYSTAQDIYKRRNIVNTTNAVPFMETFVFDAYGNALNTVAMRERTRRAFDSVVENDQTVSTISTGRIRWNYTLTATMPAFNRFIKPAAARVTGSHAATGPDNPASPPAAFSLGNGLYTGPFPAYPRDVQISGNAFASKNPSVTANTVFGVNSEIIFEDIFTSTASQTTQTVDGEPTGTATRTQTLGAGSLFAKLSTEIDEGNGKIINVGEVNAKDVAGRGINLAGADVLVLRRALANLTLGTVDDPGSTLQDSQHQLDSPLNYSNNPNSFDTIPAPTDPSTLAYYQAAAGISATRDTFTLTNDATKDVGFTSDNGNFGYLRQTVSMVALDPTIGILIVPERTAAAGGRDLKFTIKTVRITEDNTFVSLTPDEPPVFAFFTQPTNGGPLSIDSQGSLTAVAGGDGSDFEFTASIPTGRRAAGLKIAAKVQGSRIQVGGSASIQIGWDYDSTGFATGGLISFK